MFAGSNTFTDLDETKNSPARPQPIQETEGQRMSPISAHSLQHIPAVLPGLEQLVDGSGPAGNPVLPAPALETPTATTRAREILFIDPRVSDIGTLLSHLRPEVEAILIDPVRRAARQIATALAGEHDLAAIHVIAHGAPGRIDFTAGEWSAETVAEAPKTSLRSAALSRPRATSDCGAARLPPAPRGRPWSRA